MNHKPSSYTFNLVYVDDNSIQGSYFSSLLFAILNVSLKLYRQILKFSSNYQLSFLYFFGNILIAGDHEQNGLPIPALGAQKANVRACAKAFHGNHPSLLQGIILKISLENKFQNHVSNSLLCI